MNFTKDELHVMFEVNRNEIARLIKRANDPTLDHEDYVFVEQRIDMLQGIQSVVFEKLEAMAV